MSCWKRFVSMLVPKPVERLELQQLGQPIEGRATYVTPEGGIGLLEVTDTVASDELAAIETMRRALEGIGAKEINITVRRLKK